MSEQEETTPTDFEIMRLTEAFAMALRLLVERNATEVTITNGDGAILRVWRDGMVVRCEVDRLL